LSDKIIELLKEKFKNFQKECKKKLKSILLEKIEENIIQSLPM